MPVAAIEDPDLQRVLDNLLPVDGHTGDLETDLLAAIREVERRRDQTLPEAGVLINALRTELGYSWRQVTHKTGLSQRTAGQWLRQLPKLWKTGTGDAPDHD